MIIGLFCLLFLARDAHSHIRCTAIFITEFVDLNRTNSEFSLSLSLSLSLSVNVLVISSTVATVDT